MNKFYNSLIKYDKFYNKFYTSSTSSTRSTQTDEHEEEDRRQTLGWLLKHACKGTELEIVIHMISDGRVM